MQIELCHVEKAVQILVAKPLAWVVYGAGVIVVCLALAIFQSVGWLTRKSKEGAWAKRS